MQTFVQMVRLSSTLDAWRGLEDSRYEEFKISGCQDFRWLDGLVVWWLDDLVWWLVGLVVRWFGGLVVTV